MKLSKTVKRIFEYVKKYKGQILIILFCILISAGINTLFPLISKHIMDDGLLQKRTDVVMRYSLILIFLVLADQGINIVITQRTAVINSMLNFTLLKEAFKKLLKFNMDYFNKTNSTHIVNNISVDASNISRITDRGTFLAAAQVLRLIGGVAGLMVIDWKLTLLVLCVIPIKYYMVKYLTKKKKSMIEEYIKFSSEFSSWLGDTLDGIKEIKLFGVERNKIGEFIRLQRKIIKINIKCELIDRINQMSEMILAQIIVNALYIIGCIMIFNLELTVGGVFAFISYVGFVISPISLIMNIGLNFANITPSANRFFSLLDSTQEEKGKGSDLKISSGIHIEFDSIHFRYDINPVLNNVNFNINDGEKIALVGSNGSGKSSLINLLLRFYNPDSGKILLNNVNIQDYNIKDYRNIFSVVSQNIYLFNDTIKNNVAMYSKHSDQHLENAILNSQGDFVYSLPGGLDSMVGKNGAFLSGGQRQKIGMIRAMLKDSSIIILDEATSNYDIVSEQLLYDCIIENFMDKTVIIITHNETILSQVDKVIFLKDGYVDGIGNHFDLKKKNVEYNNYLSVVS